MSGRLISIRVVSKRLGIPRQTMNYLIKKGVVKVVYDTTYTNYRDGTPGKAYMYESWYENLKAWLQDHFAHQTRKYRDECLKRMMGEDSDGKV